MDPEKRDAPEPATGEDGDATRARHNVVAVFESLEEARRALLGLERAGLPADALALLGAHPDPEATEIDDPRAEAELPARIVTGAVTGAAGAGTIGALSALAIPGIGPVIAAGIWAVAGATAGGVIGGVSGMGGSEAWRATFTAVEAGKVAVGVHTDDPAVADHGHQVLERLGTPQSVRRLPG